MRRRNGKALSEQMEPWSADKEGIRARMTTPCSQCQPRAIEPGPHAWATRSSDQEILVGRDVLGQALASLPRRFTGREVVVLASRSASGLLARSTAMLGQNPVAVFDDLHGHPTSARSEAIAERLRGMQHRFVLLCLGGGSVSDTAKAVSLLLAEGGVLDEHCGRQELDGRFTFPELPRPKPPIVSVPTTLSAAEI